MNFKKLLNIIIDSQTVIISVVLSLTCIAGIYAFFFATEYYRAETTVYQKKENSSIMNQELSDFKSIAKNLGLNSSDSKINFYIPDLVNSSLIKEKILDSNFNISNSDNKVTLFEFWSLADYDSKKKNYLAKKKLDKLLDVDVSDVSGLFTILIETEDPVLSSEILNFIVEEIEKYISEKTKDHYSKKKTDIKTVMDNYEMILKHDEKKLVNFQSKNSNLIDDPEIQLQRERLIRSVEINKELFLFLKLEYEQAKIQELNNSEKIHVLDDAEPPYHKSYPHRLRIILLTAISAFFTTVYLLVLRIKFKSE